MTVREGAIPVAKSGESLRLGSSPSVLSFQAGLVPFRSETVAADFRFGAIWSGRGRLRDAADSADRSVTPSAEQNEPQGFQIAAIPKPCSTAAGVPRPGGGSGAPTLSLSKLSASRNV